MTSNSRSSDDKHPLDGEIILPEKVREHVKDSFEGQQNRVQKKFWPTVRKALRHIPFMQDVVAAYYCAMDSNTPMRARAALVGALAYFVLPIDGIPDFLTVIGFADDASVLLAVLALVGPHISNEHKEKAAKALADSNENIRGAP
ncbi:MAG: YkvA family protein [Hyphomicrobiales bacterium]